ncbi:acyl-CoA dehydrogenase family protein [Sorangium sp. So ce1000]|uniref:acyl-CoA dehydrogenase family protein n=1 Tax=Sorangium sp. So ce1000 TaxID=3133325 RepID=UPI003F604A5C
MATIASAAAASLLDAARSLVPLVEEHAQQGERERRLPDPVARAFRESGIFRMCRPRALGGLEADPLTAMQVIEELSRADGAAGWCAMICGATGVFDAYLPVEGGKEMFASPDVVTAGVFAPSGRAVDLAFTAGGAAALYAESPLQRCFRDVHAVTQHALVAPHTREVQGRVLLGLDTELPMF